MTTSGLVVGGFVYVLIAQIRGIRSMDLRWEQFARTFSTHLFRLAVLGVGLSGCLLWLLFVSVHPAAAELLSSSIRESSWIKMAREGQP